MTCAINLEQWMLDLIIDRLEGEVRHYELMLNSVDPTLRQQCKEYLPVLNEKIAYYKSFLLEQPDVSA